MKKIITQICFAIIALNSVQAQRRQLPVTLKPPVKAPKLFTTIGKFKDTSTVTAQLADSLIRLSLQIADIKKLPYTLTSYQFLYKQMVTTEDEQTGKTSKVASIKSSLFKASPLPTLWINILSENIKKGDEFFFFDVIVKDAKGRFMYAPNLKLIVE